MPAATASAATTGTAGPLTVSELVDHAAPSVVQVFADGPDGLSAGSGVRIAAGVLTNAHVVSGATDIQLYTSDYQSANATVLRVDDDLDLALLQTDLPLTTLEMEPVALQHVGDDVLVLGYPDHMRLQVESRRGGPASLSRGVVSALLDEASTGQHLIQTDAAVNHGNSGGAMLNTRGKLIGIPARVQDPGIGLAIATDTVQQFLAEQPTPVFHGRADQAGLRPAPLGEEWSLVDEHAFEHDGSFYIARYSNIDDADNNPVLDLAIVVAPSVSRAKQILETPQFQNGLTPLSVPNMGETAFAHTENDTFGVVSRQNNVVILVAETSPGDLNHDLVFGVARNVVERVATNSH
jgi:hypothetical protein